MAGSDIGYYTLPVILSFKGIDSQVEANLGKSMQDLGKKTGEQLGTAVIAGLDPTKSPKINTAIKSTSGAGKKMGDAITTEVAKNIDGKKISDKMSASVTAAVQGDVGKKIGTAVSTGITKNFDTKGLGTKITDDLAKAQSGEAFKGVGKKIGEHISTGLKNAKINQSLKDAIESPLGQAIGQEVGRRVGQAIGDQIKTIPGFDKVADTVEQVAKYAPNARDAIGGVRDAITGIKTGDAAGAVKGLKDSLAAAEPIASRLGIDLTQASTAASNVSTMVDRFTANKQGVKDTADQIQGLFGKTKIGKAAGAAGELAGPIAAAQTFAEFAPGYKDIGPNMQAQVQGKAPFDPTQWFQMAMYGAGGGPGAAVTSGMDLVPKEYNWLQEHGPSWLPKLPEALGGPKPPPKLLHGPEMTYGEGKKAFSWWAPGTPSWQQQQAAAPPPAAAGAGAISTPHASVQAAAASISVGSASISGVSLPSSAGAAPPIRPGFKSWYQTGGAIDNVPIMATAGEHMLTTADVAAMGGQQGVYDFRNALHRNGGGPIPPPPPTWGKGVPPPWLRRPGPNRAAIKGVYYGGAIGYDDGGEIKQLGEAIAGPVAKAAAEGAAKGAEAAAHSAGAGMALPAILGGSGGQQMGADIATQLLGIGAGGVGETLGLGTLFPDPMANPNVKSLIALASAFKGPLMGAMKGKLGIQQPGWRPGMAVDAMAGDQGAGASIGLPFGLPSIDLPNAPEGGGAPPGGGPVGGGDTHVDASLTVHGDVGSDKALRDHQQQIQRGLDRLAPMPTGPN